MGSLPVPRIDAFVSGVFPSQQLTLLQFSDQFKGLVTNAREENNSWIITFSFVPYGQRVRKVYEAALYSDKQASRVFAILPGNFFGFSESQIRIDIAGRNAEKQKLSVPRRRKK